MSLYQPSAGLKSLCSSVLTAFAIAVIRFLVKPIEDKSLLPFLVVVQRKTKNLLTANLVPPLTIQE